MVSIQVATLVSITIYEDNETKLFVYDKACFGYMKTYTGCAITKMILP